MPLLVVTAALDWRFVPPAAWLLAPLAVVLALRLAWREPQLARRVLPTVLLIAAVLAALRLPGDQLWPCACGPTARFARLLGAPAEAWAVVAAALAALAVWRGWAVAAPLTWALAGGSLLYLALLLHLRVMCTHCLAVHGTILIAAALSCADALAWRWRLSALVLAAACLGAALWWSAPPAFPRIDDSGMAPPPRGPANRP